MKQSTSILIQARCLRETPFRQRISFTLVFLLLLHGLNGLAATVRQVAVEEMTQASEFIFEGQVVEAVSKLDAGGGQIHTLVTFQITDVIKGSYARHRIVLSYLGGTVNGLTLEVSDMHLPVLGEKGIYFVESLQRTQVHPLYGWDQGHFVIKTGADGVSRVRTRGQAMVVGVGVGVPGPELSLSHGVARGIAVSEDAKERGMSVSEFKAKLREINRGRP